MNTLKIIIGYLLNVGAIALQAYLVTKTDPATAASITAPMALAGSRVLQQTQLAQKQ